MIVLPVVLIYEKKGPAEHILEWLHTADRRVFWENPKLNIISWCKEINNDL